MFSKFLIVALSLAYSFGAPTKLTASPQIITRIPTDKTSTDFDFKIPLPACNVADEADILSGRPEEGARWRNGISFQFSSSFSSSEAATINNALYDLSQIVGCVEFRRWSEDATPTGDYVFIVKGGSGSGCSAAVGRIGGRQTMNLEAPACIHNTVIIHEAIHSLGFHHEQVRPDRDSYVNIFLQNVIPGKEHNFDRKPSSLTFGVPYDARSIMHYSSSAFSSNGQSTILTKNGGTIPYNYDVTSYDSQKLKAMYNCY